MKKLTLLKSMLLLCALVAGSGSVWAQSYSITFKDNGSESDNSTKRTTIADIIATGADLVSAIPTASNVYQARSGRGVKLGASSKTGEVKLTLAHAVKPSKIVVRARKYSDTETTFNVNGNDFTLSEDAGEDVTVNYDGNTEVSDIDIKTTSKRAYAIAVTIYLPATFGAGKSMISFSNTDYALDLTTANLPSGLAAYKVTAATNSAVTLTAVNSTVAAGTGVILTGTESTTYNIPVVATGTDISGSNLLVATDGTSTVSDAAVLSNGAFHPLSAAGVIAAGKAYLPYANIEGGDPFTGGSHVLDVVFDNDNVTGIRSVENQKALLDGAFYNLAGQRVAQPKKGMYIVNGKKVIIK